MKLTHAALLGLLLVAGSTGAKANPYDDHVRILHHLCDAGDRRACVKFGIEIGRHQERVADWRAHHPDWFEYER